MIKSKEQPFSKELFNAKLSSYGILASSFLIYSPNYLVNLGMQTH